MGVSKNRRKNPQDGWFIMENPMNKWMIWGGKNPYFWFNTHITPVAVPVVSGQGPGGQPVFTLAADRRVGVAQSEGKRIALLGTQIHGNLSDPPRATPPQEIRP